MTVVYRSRYKRPQFPPKIDFGGPNNRLQRLIYRQPINYDYLAYSIIHPTRQLKKPKLMNASRLYEANNDSFNIYT